MSIREDTEFVVRKILAAAGAGEETMGMVSNRSVEHWRAVFNEVSRELGMPVIEPGPLGVWSEEGEARYKSRIQAAFEESAGKPAIILADATGHDNVPDFETANGLSNFIHSLTMEFPKAVYIQMEPNMPSRQDISLFVMKPHVPRKAGEPVYAI